MSTEKIQSKDGTSIAFERSGQGPALILVDGALCSRAFGPMPKLAPLLSRRFTVYTYDRRGRGESGDAARPPPYARERELEDLEALVRAAGGSAFALGLSSGAALALEAAAAGVGLAKVVAYEPPYVNADGRHAQADHLGRLERLVSEDRRGDALQYFMRRMVGVPGVFVLVMRLMPRTWRKLLAVAHTLPYDAAVMGDFSPPIRRLGGIRVPVLVMHGERSDPRLKRAAGAVAEVIPGARLRPLERQSHDVKPEALAPAVEAFLAGGGASLEPAEDRRCAS